MQRTALLSIVFVAACGGGGDATPAQVPTASATASIATAPPPAPLGIPRDAPFVATFDISEVASSFPAVRAEIEHDFQLPDGALSGDLGQLGIDTKRPVAFAVATPSPEAAALVHDLRTAPGTAIETARRMYGIPLLFGFRVLLPATDPHRLSATLRELVTKAGWKQKGDAFFAPHQALAIRSDVAWVALDIAAALGTEASLPALEHVLAGPLEQPASQREIVHVTCSPQAFAPVPYLMGMTQIIGAISGESVNPEQKERIFAVGSKEANAVFTLAEQNGKPIFDRVDLTASVAPFEVAIRAKPAAGFVMPPADDWAASTALVFPGSIATLSGRNALIDAWPFPPHAFGLARDGGLFAFAVGLPEVLAEAPRELPAMTHDAGPSEDVARRFERIGEAWNAAGNEIWYGVLPANATRETAQCSLATQKCAGATKLAVGKATKAGNGFAKVVLIDKRWVLLLAKEAATLDVKPTTTNVSPLHLEGDAKRLGDQLHTTVPLPAHVVGDVSQGEGAILFRFTAP
ncbi:MAG TPA: hypothetical protein VGH28_26690 [Polyangiaceae bacterium]|jgi:hypothetical protein